MNHDSQEISQKDKKQFILTLFILPIAPAVLLFKFGHLKLALEVLILLWFLACFNLISATFFDFFYRNSKKFTKFLGDNLAKIVLFIVYVLCVLPTGFLVKLIKRDRLSLKKGVKTSYWKDLKVEEDHNYEYQF